MKHTRAARSSLLLAATLVVAAGLALAATDALTATGRTATGPGADGAGRQPYSNSASSAQVGASLAAHFSSTVRHAEAAANRLATAPGMPTCKPPPLPAPTQPPGNSYGVPFLAAVTNGQILAGYDEWTANHSVWTAAGKTYHLYPWQAKVFDISGWVTGLLQLPSLNADISPQDVVFCDQGGQGCVSANPPTGDCIHVDLSGAPTTGQPPPPMDTNLPPPGHKCYRASNFCIPYVIALQPVGTTTLTVTGVQPNGALDLRVSTSAITHVSITLPGVSESCSDNVTSVTLTTQSGRVPKGGPIPPKSGNPDLRGLQTPPTPLTGPLATASSIVASNDFSVPAFSQTACPLLAAVFDAPLGGWNAKSSSDAASENNNYFDQTPPPADAGTPGWVQFTAATTVSSLGFPIGPPSGFHFSSESP